MTNTVSLAALSLSVVALAFVFLIAISGYRVYHVLIRHDLAAIGRMQAIEEGVALHASTCQFLSGNTEQLHATCHRLLVQAQSAEKEANRAAEAARAFLLASDQRLKDCSAFLPQPTAPPDETDALVFYRPSSSASMVRNTTTRFNYKF